MKAGPMAKPPWVSHTQAVERAIRQVCDAAKKVRGQEGRDGRVLAQVEGRKLLAKKNTKADLATSLGSYKKLRGGGGRSQGNDSGYMSSHPGTQSQEADGDTADTVHCNCGQEAVIRTVQKDGANKGRQFYVCARPREEQCQMFQWADQPAPPSSARPGPAHQSGGGADSQEVNCNCGQPSAKRTVQKEGNNKGRQFYCCPKPRDEQCGFFQWEDEAGAGPAAGPAPGNNSYNQPSFNGPTARGRGGAGGRGGVKRKAGGGDGGGDKRQRKCGLCHEPGHVRTKCPMKSDWNDEDSGWN